MGSKTISLKDEAYERLKVLKTENKSFSDVVIEITEDKSEGLEALVAKNSDTSIEELIETRKEEEFDRDREQLFS